MHTRSTTGFTIVELLIVIVVIAILAALTIVSYNGITRQAREVSLKSDLHNGASILALSQGQNGSYPTPTLPTDVKNSTDTTLSYTSTGASFCLTAQSISISSLIFNITDKGSISPGPCPGHIAAVDGAKIQTITPANCPTSRVRTVDARDDHTYWVQKMGDGKCWMLTNLAYAGGGTNTYGDVKTLSNGTSDGSTIYSEPKYYVVPSTTSFTTEPTNPSTATTGTGQHGYLYNWCAAMGNQTNTSACMNAVTPLPDPLVSVCPAGWRLPTGDAGGEFTALNNAVNSGSTTTDDGLRTNWLLQRSGTWANSFSTQNSSGYYRTSTQSASPSSSLLSTLSTYANPTGWGNKAAGFAVRCLAN